MTTLRRLFVPLLLVTLCAAAAPKTVAELKAKAEKMKDKDRAQVYSEIARELVEVANRQFGAGENETAKASIKESLAYAVKATEISAHHDSKIKKTEINLRETARRLEEVRRTLAIDDQPPLAEAAARIEQLRKQLMTSMFGKGEK